MGAIYYLFGVAIGTCFDFFAFCFFTFLFFKYLIFQTYTVIEISPAMKFYICTEVITTFLVFWDLLFYSIFWNPINVDYNGLANFILGATQVLAIAAKPVSVFFLGIDRILCITFPFKTLPFQKYLPIIGDVIFVIIVDIIVFLKLIMNSLPNGDEIICGSFACRVPISEGNYYTTVRFLNGGSNILMSITLAIMIKTKLHSTSANIRNARLALLTVCIAVFFDFVPHVLVFTTNQIIGINVARYIGPYSTIVNAFDSFCCSMLYSRTFKKVPKKPALRSTTSQKLAKSNQTTTVHIINPAV